MKGGNFDFDCIVIGSGSAGFGAALEARKYARSVALVEKGKLGGECPNWACVPTKALLRSAEVLELVRRASEFGISVKNFRVNWPLALKRKQAAVEALLGGGRLERLLEIEGITLMKGAAVFSDAQTLKVGKRSFRSKRFIIAAGTSPYIPPIPGLREAGYLDFKDAVSIKKLPKSLLILGGGPVGVEFAQIFQAFGAKVTLVQRRERILEREEPEISAVVAAAYKAKGIKLLVGAEVKEIRGRGRKKVATVVVGHRTERVEVNDILVATGKRAATKELQVTNAGVAVSERGGYILVDNTLQTSAPHIYAVGDVKVGMQFTHVAASDGPIAAWNAFHPKKIRVDYRVVPRGTFSDPEVGSVGLTEAEARAKGLRVMVGRSEFAGFGKALTYGDRRGLAKVVVDKKTGQILGAGIVGYAAAEIIHEIALAMQAGLKFDEVASMIHIYPTMSEAVKMACANVNFK